jgi:hypothetical protein
MAEERAEETDGTEDEEEKACPAPRTFGPESSDSLRTFGAVVQALREHADLNREAFAPLVRYSTTRKWSACSRCGMPGCGRRRSALTTP